MDDLHQDKIQKLEEELLATSNELVRVKTEKAALQLKGMSNLTGDVEELALLRQELRKEQEKLAETEEKIGKLDNLERIISQQQDEISKLSTLKNSLKLKLLSQEPKNDDAINELKDKLAEAEAEIAKLSLNNIDKAYDDNNIAQGLSEDLAEAKSTIEFLTTTNKELYRENEELKKEIELLKEEKVPELEKIEIAEQNLADTLEVNISSPENSAEESPVSPADEADLEIVPKQELKLEPEQPPDQNPIDCQNEIAPGTQTKSDSKPPTFKTFKPQASKSLPDDVMLKWLGG